MCKCQNNYQIYIVFNIPINQEREANYLMGKKRAIYKKQQVPFFIKKLFDILEDPSNNQIIAWSPSNAGFIINNQSQLTNKILPSYFKHHNLASFIRQLNLYGFHKTQNTTEYTHENLNRLQPDDMKLIKRTVKIKKKGPSQPQKKQQNRKDLIINGEELAKLTAQNSKLRQENFKLMKTKNQNNKILRRLKACTKKSKKLSEKVGAIDLPSQNQKIYDKRLRIPRRKSIKSTEMPDLNAQMQSLQDGPQINSQKVSNQNRMQLYSDQMADNLINQYLS